MKIQDFEINKTFYGPAGFRWLCTDKGSRTITAIMLHPDKADYWFKGPPYSVEEKVFDEHDMKSLYNSVEEDLNDRVSNWEQSSHPGFDSEDAFKMLNSRCRDYPQQKLLKRDRVSVLGEILHPYGAIKKDKVWFIQVFEIFSKTYSEIEENEFVQLDLATQEAMRQRKNNFK